MPRKTSPTPTIPMHDRIHWDWPGWLPAGFLTVLASAPGVGKSFLSLRIATSYLDGRPWPDGAPFTGRTANILWCEGEPGYKMHRQRLCAMRLDPDEMTFLFAVDLLKDLLSRGPLPAYQISAEARAAGISRPTLKRANSRLGIKSNKTGGSR